MSIAELMELRGYLCEGMREKGELKVIEVKHEREVEACPHCGSGKLYGHGWRKWVVTPVLPGVAKRARLGTALRNWIERAEKASGPLGALAATAEEWELEIETHFLPDAPPAPLKPLTAKSPCSGAKLAAMLTNTTSSG